MGYGARDVFNADETGLFFRLLPDKTLLFKGEDCQGLCVDASNGFILDHEAYRNTWSKDIVHLCASTLTDGPLASFDSFHVFAMEQILRQLISSGFVM